MPPSIPPPLRLLERSPSRRAQPTRRPPPPAPWWTADGLRQRWQQWRLPA